MASIEAQSLSVTGFLPSRHKRYSDTLTLRTVSPACQLVASLSRLAPVKSDLSVLLHPAGTKECSGLRQHLPL